MMLCREQKKKPLFSEFTILIVAFDRLEETQHAVLFFHISNCALGLRGNELV